MLTYRAEPGSDSAKALDALRSLVSLLVERATSSPVPHLN
jgi:hypothetical protein